MGWKNVKEHYGIGHQVHIDRGDLCISSPFITGLIRVVRAPGKPLALKSSMEHCRGGNFGNADLDRLWREFEADPARLAELLDTPDTFGETVPVFSYEEAAEAEIIEQRCEAGKFGWPENTTCGQTMREGTHFLTRGEALEAAIRSAHGWLSMTKQQVKRRRRELADAKAQLTKRTQILAALTLQQQHEPS